MSKKPATVPTSGPKKPQVSRTPKKTHPTFMDLHGSDAKKKGK